MKIHFWLPDLDSAGGGIGVFLRSVLEIFIRKTPGVQKLVLIKNDRQLLLPAAFATVDTRYRPFGRLPKGPIRTVIFALGLTWAALRDRPDLIVVGHANFSPVAAWIRRTLGMPFWGLVHGIEVWDESGARLSKSLQQANRLFSISRFTRDQLVTQQGLDETRFSLLHCTFDETRFQPAPRSLALLARLGVPEDRRVILTICRLASTERYKGYDNILSALPTILRQVPNTHYVLGGTGDDVPRLREQVRQSGMEGHVTLAGFVPEPELVDYYNLCDVFAMPSRKEGFGIVFLEALACGKPVLAAASGGTVDALCDGELGVLVDPTDTAELAESLVAILMGRHPHPLIYSPIELRRRVIERFGSERFDKVLSGYLTEFLPTVVDGKRVGG